MTVTAQRISLGPAQWNVIFPFIPSGWNFYPVKWFCFYI